MLFKALYGPDRPARNYAYEKWAYPTATKDDLWTPGAWTTEIPNPVLDQRGYVVAQDAQVLAYMGPFLYEVEVRGTVVQGPNEWAVSQARLLRPILAWNARTARLCGVFFARRLLARETNPDSRSVEACNVAERYVKRDASGDEMLSAKRMAREAAMTRPTTPGKWAAFYACASYSLTDVNGKYFPCYAWSAGFLGVDNARMERPPLWAYLCGLLGLEELLPSQPPPPPVDTVWPPKPARPRRL